MANTSANQGFNDDELDAVADELFSRYDETFKQLARAGLVASIQKVGNEHMIPLDNALVDLLGVRAGETVELSIRDGSLIVNPLSFGLSEENRNPAISRFRDRYAAVLKRLRQ